MDAGQRVVMNGMTVLQHEQSIWGRDRPGAQMSLEDGPLC